MAASLPLEQLADRATAAFQGKDWPTALDAIVRLRRELGAKTPKIVYAMGAQCLHRLGRLAEAEGWAVEGLGEQRALIGIPPVRTEAEHLAAWGGRTDPVISIICTTYNHERYVEQALRGFLCQETSHPFEILVHDDASTDATARIIAEWQARYPRLIRSVIQTENQLSRGHRPVETLLKLARGEFIAMCEGDDFWVASDKLQKQADFLIEHPHFSCTAHNHLHYVEASLTVNPWIVTRSDVVMTSRQLMAVSRLLWVPTLMFRKLFDAYPPEHRLCFSGDFLLTSYLGTFGPCMYFESMLASVRRENAFSTWTPRSAEDKERNRMKSWMALIEMHTRMEHPDAVIDLLGKVTKSPLPEDEKMAMLATLLERNPSLMQAA